MLQTPGALATSREIAGSIPDEAGNFFFPLHLIFPVALRFWGLLSL
jgi:hypothetical protein